MRNLKHSPPVKKEKELKKKKSRQLMCYLKHSIISGPTLGEAPAFPRPPNFFKKKEKTKRKEKKYTFSNKRNL